MLYFRLYNSRSRFTYFLYEKGIRVFNHSSNGVYFIPFYNIKYIYKYHAGIYSHGRINAMAFRALEFQPWNIIMNNITNSHQLINTIIHQQVMIIGAMKLNDLSRGETLEFDIINRGNSWLNNLLHCGLINLNTPEMKATQMNTSPLLLNALMLKTPGSIINIEKISRIETLRAKGHYKIYLFDALGNILFSVNYSALINADLFIALVEHMVQNHITIY